MRTQLRASRIALPRATAFSYVLLLAAVLLFGVVLDQRSPTGNLSGSVAASASPLVQQ